MAMALPAEWTDAGLLAGLNNAATASSSDRAAYLSGVGTKDHVMALACMCLEGVTGPFTPGHTPLVELVGRVFGMVICRPTRAAHGLGRHSSEASARGPAEAGHTHGMHIVTIIFHINATTEDPFLPRRQEMQASVCIDVITPSTSDTWIFNMKIANDRAQTMEESTGFVPWRAAATNNGTSITITGNTLRFAAAEAAMGQEVVIIIVFTTRADCVIRELTSDAAEAPKT
jgi:hypothetical protein